MNIRDQAKQHIKPFFADTRFTYHSWDHTLTVVDNVRQIASMERVSDQEMEILELAAYFHDSGYQQGSEGHEARGARIAREFLTSKDFPQSRITLVEELIRVTQMEVEATNQLEFIIKDADVAHIASADYLIYGDRLRQEEETIHSTTHTDLEWAKYNRQFIKNYKWKSKSGKKLYREGQKENVAELKEIIKELQLEADQKIPSRGIETMYRVALRNHNQLSKIADNKANIMLSITALMLSILLSSLAPKIDANPRLLWPTILIVTVCLVTMIYAILATRPSVSSASYSREKLLNNEVNLLFFGNFYKIPLEEFEWGMNRLMEDKELLYGSLSKDLYFLGSVLAKKYEYLRIGYMIFMVGLVLSVLAFIAAFTFGL